MIICRISEVTVRWILSMLDTRRCKMSFGTWESDPFQVSSGLPRHGSLLSCARGLVNRLQSGHVKGSWTKPINNIKANYRTTYIPGHAGIWYNEIADQNPLAPSNYTPVMSESGCGWRLERTHPREEPGCPLAGWKMQASSSDEGLTNTPEEVRRASTLNKF